MSEILTAEELAAMLKISKWQVYEWTKTTSRTGEVRPNPIPSFRIGTLVRFRKSDVESWLAKLTVIHTDDQTEKTDDKKPVQSESGSRSDSCKLYA